MPELPPKPDPNTGEPRPPRAPVPARHEATRTNRTRRKPEPPDGRGPTPVLAHYREQARYPLLHALKAATTFAVLLLLISSGFTVTEWFVLPVAGLHVHLALRHSVANRAELTAAAREQFPELAAVEPPRLPLARNTSTDDEHSPNSSEPANHHRGEPILAMRDSVLGHLRFHDKKHRS